MAMVATLKFDDLFPSCKCTHQAQHRHTGFCARVHKANHFNARHGINYHLSQHVLETRGCTKTSPLLGSFLNGFDYVRMSVTTNGWPPGADIVNVLVAIHIPGISAFDTIEDDRLSSNRLE